MIVFIDGTPREFALEAMIVAGYTGRDREAVLHHIHELEEIGVAPPPYVPFYWRFPPWLAMTTDRVVVAGANTSGEAELCLLVDGDEMFVTVGSDHTDRSAEAIDVGMSKAICPKPIGGSAFQVAAIGDRWSELVLRSWLVEDGDERLYQEGVCANLVPPLELLAGMPFERPRCFSLFTGTVPAIGGVRPGSRFRAELFDPQNDASVSLSYDIVSLETPSMQGA